MRNITNKKKFFIHKIGSNFFSKNTNISQDMLPLLLIYTKKIRWPKCVQSIWKDTGKLHSDIMCSCQNSSIKWLKRVFWWCQISNLSQMLEDVGFKTNSFRIYMRMILLIVYMIRSGLNNYLNVRLRKWQIWDLYKSY